MSIEWGLVLGGSKPKGVQKNIKEGSMRVLWEVQGEWQPHELAVDAPASVEVALWQGIDALSIELHGVLGAIHLK